MSHDVHAPEAQAQQLSTVDLQAEIAAAREELAGSLAALKGETSPGAIARRGARAFVCLFTDEFGGVRPKRVAIAGAVVAGYIALRVLRRRRR